MIFGKAKEVSEIAKKIKSELWKKKQWDEKISSDEIQDMIAELEDISDIAEDIMWDIRPITSGSEIKINGFGDSISVYFKDGILTYINRKTKEKCLTIESAGKGWFYRKSEDKENYQKLVDRIKYLESNGALYCILKGLKDNSSVNII